MLCSVILGVKSISRFIISQIQVQIFKNTCSLSFSSRLLKILSHSSILSQPQLFRNVWSVNKLLKTRENKYSIILKMLIFESALWGCSPPLARFVRPYVHFYICALLCTCNNTYTWDVFLVHIHTNYRLRKYIQYNCSSYYCRWQIAYGVSCDICQAHTNDRPLSHGAAAAYIAATQWKHRADWRFLPFTFRESPRPQWTDAWKMLEFWFTSHSFSQEVLWQPKNVQYKEFGRSVSLLWVKFDLTC